MPLRRRVRLIMGHAQLWSYLISSTWIIASAAMAANRETFDQHSLSRRLHSRYLHLNIALREIRSALTRTKAMTAHTEPLDSPLTGSRVPLQLGIMFATSYAVCCQCTARPNDMNCLGQPPDQSEK
ncbi:hypothetical protein PLICRDRAFT_424302 [Plicaturopsis crispa FD-325 SS-3]|nr:hypothetical protein PLICRDRAFT_424302 [Plicaturopsis crispa FD-325 SS-3]